MDAHQEENTMTLRYTRRAFVGASAAFLGFGLDASFNKASAQTKTLRLSHHLPPGHLVDTASKRFAEIVAEKSGGQLKIEVFPAGQLAGLRQGTEAVQVGTLDLVWSDFGTLANWQKQFGFISLPFLFRDNDHVLAVLTGKVGEDLATEVRDTQGIEILGYGIAGFRVIAARDREIGKPEDLQGLKIRVPEVPVYVSAFKKLGANPTPMAWGEVYTALQTGVIDGVENPSEGLFVGRMQEVTKFASKTNHIMTDVNLTMSTAVLSGLPGDQQEIIKSAAATAIEEFNTASKAAGEEYWNKLAEALKANPDPDREAFKAAMLPVWDEMDAAAGGQMKPWIDQVLAVQ